MPIYEYHCRSCGHLFERIVRAGATPPPCPECERDDVERVPSRFGIGGGGDAGAGSRAASGAGCAGCSGGTCSTCH